MEADGVNSNTALAFSGIVAYKKIVVSSGSGADVATLNIQLDPDQESVIVVNGHSLSGIVTIGIRRPSSPKNSGDYKMAAGSPLRGMVTGLSSVDIDFFSPRAFRFALLSIDVLRNQDRSNTLALSKISIVPHRAPQPP